MNGCANWDQERFSSYVHKSERNESEDSNRLADATTTYLTETVTTDNDSKISGAEKPLPPVHNFHSCKITSVWSKM
jgi:hypothetical protein